MERAHVSTAYNELLREARLNKEWTVEQAAEYLGVDATTIERWESGDTFPQPVKRQKLCKVYGKTLKELGLEKEPAGAGTKQVHLVYPSRPMIFSSFLNSDLTLRLERVRADWSRSARYHELQELVILEIEDDITMNPDDSLLNRRDALYRLALLALNSSGLSASTVVVRKSYEDILEQCSAGIIACWYLRRGKELTFADDVASCYLPTLMSIAQTASTQERKAAADLVAQCFLLKAALSWQVTTPLDGIGYAQQAAIYSQEAGNPLLEIVALRAEAAAQCYANQWGNALKVGLKANSLLSTTPKELVPPLARSYVHAGLATYQAHHGNKQDALASLRKAHAAFHAQSKKEKVPLWVDHTIGNLLLNDGLTHTHLDMYEEAGNAFQKVEEDHKENLAIPFACRVEVWIEQAINEASREDQSPSIQVAIDAWTKAIEGAKEIDSKKHLIDAHTALRVMRSTWRWEDKIKKLRERF